MSKYAKCWQCQRWTLVRNPLYLMRVKLSSMWSKLKVHSFVQILQPSLWEEKCNNYKLLTITFIVSYTDINKIILISYITFKLAIIIYLFSWLLWNNIHKKLSCIILGCWLVEVFFTFYTTEFTFFLRICNFLPMHIITITFLTSMNKGNNICHIMHILINQSIPPAFLWPNCLEKEKPI